jgi:hypothetical protein
MGLRSGASRCRMPNLRGLRALRGYFRLSIYEYFKTSLRAAGNDPANPLNPAPERWRDG